LKNCNVEILFVLWSWFVRKKMKRFYGVVQQQVMMTMTTMKTLWSTFKMKQIRKCLKTNTHTHTSEEIKRLFQKNYFNEVWCEERVNAMDVEVSAMWWSEMWLFRRREHQQQSESSKWDTNWLYWHQRLFVTKLEWRETTCNTKVQE
jgi:hypothetical protein